MGDDSGKLCALFHERGAVLPGASFVRVRELGTDRVDEYSILNLFAEP